MNIIFCADPLEIAKPDRAFDAEVMAKSLDCPTRTSRLNFIGL